MNILALKLILAPIIIGSASLAERKWGAAISGWLIGLPLTSGPVMFILAISHDKAFAFNAVRGVLSGGFPLIAYCLSYAWLAKKFDWRAALFGSIAIFAGMTAYLQNVTISFIPLFFWVILSIFAGLWLMPKHETVENPPESGMETERLQPGKWDIPARILIGTSFILLLTGIAPFIGARLTGLLTTIPLNASILTVFAHRRENEAGAINVLRGLILGLFAFAGFYLALGLLIEKTSLALSFAAAILVSLSIQGVTLFFLRQVRK